MNARDSLAKTITTVTDGWEGPLDDVHDVPRIVDAILASDWLAEWDRTVAEKAWDEGHSWGWSDAQEAHDVRQEMARADWTLSTRNPYQKRADQ